MRLNVEYICQMHFEVGSHLISKNPGMVSLVEGELKTHMIMKRYTHMSC